MSYRIEEKLLINKHNLFYLKDWLNNNSFKKIFEDRIIISKYFDNNKSQMYVDSTEGIVPRKKIRIRNYNYNEKENYLENKINSPVQAKYNRQYFSNNIMRITLDTKIVFSWYNSNYKIHSDKIVAEVKVKETFDKNILNQLPFDRTRFSKYCEGINLLKNFKNE